MRCPKCRYISFDSNDRCRNCGYEFSLSVDVEALDLPIQTGDEAIGPLSDFALADLDGPDPAGRPSPAAPPIGSKAPRARPVNAPRGVAARVPPASAAPPASPAPPGRPIPGSLDLPLFKLPGDRAFDDDAPLVTPPAVPRAPLAVRRSSPGLQRGARAMDEPELDLGGPPSDRPSAPLSHAPSAPVNDYHNEHHNGHHTPHHTADAALSASTGPRMLAAALDAAILGFIGAIVLYFTLQVCGLTFGEVAVLPRVPFGAFLLLVGGGYFVLFTAAGGQTIGKMAAGIRVVPVEADAQWSDRVPPGRAVLRAVGYLVSLLPVGLGFLPALFGPERRAIHDRLADTRVVKA